MLVMFSCLQSINLAAGNNLVAGNMSCMLLRHVFPAAPSALCSSTTWPRPFCMTGLGLHLDYCNIVLVGLPAATLAPLQRVLRMAARLVLDLKPRNHVTPALRELHWLLSCNESSTNCVFSCTRS